MFERRLKVFLFVLAIVTAVLIGRAVDLQILGREHWVEEAAKSLHHETLTETTRGRLLDVRGRPLAEDAYCFDACVDYRAIPKDPDPDWVHEIAAERVKARDAGQHDKTVSTRTLARRTRVSSRQARASRSAKVSTNLKWPQAARLRALFTTAS